ncbi:unnamed protein product [Trichobilharzia szidati]|nr:unnamed protein product [Trichobilharzia szidati]
MLPSNHLIRHESDSSVEQNIQDPDFPWSWKPRHKLTGLLNQGGTCYLNTLLQTLLHTPEFTCMCTSRYPRVESFII